MGRAAVELAGVFVVELTTGVLVTIESGLIIGELVARGIMLDTPLESKLERLEVVGSILDAAVVLGTIVSCRRRRSFLLYIRNKILTRLQSIER